MWRMVLHALGMRGARGGKAKCSVKCAAMCMISDATRAWQLQSAVLIVSLILDRVPEH